MDATKLQTINVIKSIDLYNQIGVCFGGDTHHITRIEYNSCHGVRDTVQSHSSIFII